MKKDEARLFDRTKRHALELEEANTLLRESNESLEERVAERTAELQQALRDLAALQQQVTEHERIEKTKDELIALVSHELRTPMTSIHGSLDLVHSGLAGEVSRDAARLVEIAWRNSQHLVRLVSGILDAQKIAAGRMTFNTRDVDLLPLLQQAVESNRAYADGFGITFVLDGAAPEVRVTADPDRVLQVMTNLLGNAAKFSTAGSDVLVTMERQSPFVRVRVTDHGPGIPPPFRARIFQKFAQATPAGLPSRGGSGLGLSIAKAIVEGLGGRIGFSTASAGTTFHFDLPEARRASSHREVFEEAECRPSL